MVNYNYRYILLSAWAICFSFLLSYAQPSVKTSVDKNEILIGEHLKVKIEASISPGIAQMDWLTIPDSLPHFEVIEKSKIDSTFSNGQVTSMLQTITFTSFDSGKWVLPSFKIHFSQSGKPAVSSVMTDSLLINVSFSLSDSTSQIRDIKPIKEVEVDFPIWYWIAVALSVLVLVALLIWLYRRWKRRATTSLFQAKLPPYEEAMQELEKLKQFNLSNPDEVKTYHTKLAGILKRYLSRKSNINYMNKTTGEILIQVTEQIGDKATQTSLAASLRCGDAVKFAKFVPDWAESKNSSSSIKAAIDAIQQNAILQKPINPSR
jgi:Domain of unknown function (DUF4381)